MESPRNHGSSDEEEYSSCESGWTMYIEDAFHGNDHSSVVVDDEDDSQVKEADDGHEKDDGNSSGDEESDDSMASDASSGPSNQLLKNINKHAAGKNSSKQVYLQKRQNTEKILSTEGEKSELKSRTRTSAASRVQSKGKVSKTK
ncbi:Protein SOB FIVE-LIKE 1 [Cardamine amara subsp. amara]|uniref:Protein SOB FIVE-LIKE 1 n=1 Tax=Cardamine amara subsp. amara TaxID=228776 RepID=A0ABD0ZUX9_CARAN